MFLALDECHDAVNAVEVLHARLVGLDSDAEVLLDKRDHSKGGNGIQDAAGPEWRVVEKVRRLLAREKLGKDVLPDLFFHVLCRHIVHFQVI